MNELWQRLERRLTSVPGGLADLQSPVDENQLEKLSRRVAGRLPSELIESMRIHDGQIGDLFLFGPYRLSPINEMLSYCKPNFFKRALGLGGPRNSIPIANNGGSSELILELRTGEIRDFWEDGDSVIFASFRDFFERVVLDVEKNVLEFDATTQGFVIRDEPDAYWPKKAKKGSD